MVKIQVLYQGDLRTQATHGPSRTELITDAPVDNQGKGEAFAPTDLVSAALGSCILTIMGIYARRHEIDLRGSRARVRKEMVADPIRRVGRLEVLIDLPGHIEAARRPALEKVAHACPVERSLHPDVQFEITFRYGTA